MPAVFIHGVADTFRVWDGVRRHLTRKDTVTLALPGFDAALPIGFNASKEDYVQWIIKQLESIAAPVDLVGHDWGCILAMRVLTLRPDLVRTWAAGSGPISPEYEWHPLAKIWQTPVEGEYYMANLDKDSLSNYMCEAGVKKKIAIETVARIDDRMKDSILKLYRSAVTVGLDWQPELARVRRRGMVFWGESDKDCPVRFADRLAADAGANRLVKVDGGHWIPLEHPLLLANALEEHWFANG